MNTSRFIPCSILLVGLAGACGDDPAGPAPGADTGDAIADASADTTADIAAPDTTADATPDATPDATVDAVGDTAADATDTGGDGGTTDASTDADAADAGPPFEPTGAYKEVKALPVDDLRALTGLQGRVDVTFDEWGVPHILATSVHDAMMVNGYLHARDRFPQMEMIRRTTSGTLAKLAGAADEGIVEDDIFARVMGFRRLAEQDYADLPTDSVERTVLDSYAAGVNAYINRLRDGDAKITGELALLFKPANLEDWEPVDGLVLARYQIYRLSFDAKSEIGYTQKRVAADAVYHEGADDPALAARAGIRSDILGWAPAAPAIQYPNFPPPDLVPSPLPPKPAGAKATGTPWRAPSSQVLADAARFLEGFKSELNPLRNAQFGASNSWVVSGAKTASGNAMLANDPHLDNDSPALFYQAHIVVEPATEADGPALNVFGAGFPGLPGVLIGHNENVAWGLTTASYDYTDAFLEQLVWKDGEELPRVLRDGVEVELDVYEETIEVGLGGDVTETITVKIPWVPGRGPLSPVISGKELKLPEGNEALSYAWRGFEPSPEIRFLVRLLSASDVADVEDAMQYWVLGSQNLVYAFKDGSIFSSGQSYVPERPAAAKTWDPLTNPDGWAPWWVLDGTGQHDWMGPMDRDLVPHVLDPEKGYVVAANNDQVGVTLDGNPLNDYAYIGYDYDVGFRAWRIEQLLLEHMGKGPISLVDMGEIQNDTHSNVGEALLGRLLSASEALLEAYDAPEAHPDLAALVAAHPDAKARVQQLHTLLSGWDKSTWDGVWGDQTADQKMAAARTSLFNFWMVSALKAAFGDEIAAAPGFSPGDGQQVAGMMRLLDDPTGAATYSDLLGESVLWDDLSTPDHTETSKAILAGALFTADAKLTEAFGSDDPSTWLWGKLHGKTFDSIIPSFAGGVSLYTWPQPDEGYPNGFPRRGDSWNVNVCNAGYNDYTFTCGSGPIMRFVVEMTKDGPVAFNTIPGGQVWDLKSPHFRDLLALWLDHDRHPFLYAPADVGSNVEAHHAFVP